MALTKASNPYASDPSKPSNPMGTPSTTGAYNGTNPDPRGGPEGARRGRPGVGNGTAAGGNPPRPPAPRWSPNLNFQGPTFQSALNANRDWNSELAANLAAQSAAGDYTSYMGGLNVRNRGWDQQLASSNEQARLNRQGLDIDNAALMRQMAYLSERLGLDTDLTNLGYADIGVQDAAAQRQYGLINADRADTRATWGRAQEENFDQQQAVNREEAAAIRNERLNQRKMIEQSAANGDISMIGSIESKELNNGLKDQLAKLSDDRAGLFRRLAETKQSYFARIRELDEREASTNDARERLRLQRERLGVEQRMKELAAKEDRAKMEDQNRQNFIKAALIELGRRSAEDSINQERALAFIGAADAARRRDEANAKAFGTALQSQRNAATLAFQSGARPGNSLPFFRNVKV